MTDLPDDLFRGAAMRARNAHGIERTPDEVKETLTRVLASVRKIMTDNGLDVSKSDARLMGELSAAMEIFPQLAGLLYLALVESANERTHK